MVIHNKQEVTILGTFAEEFDFCWACGIDPTRQHDAVIEWPRRLEIHHVIKFGRAHERWNLSRLCMLCHALAEGHHVPDSARSGKHLPKLELEHVIWLKKRHDPGYYDRAAMRKKRGQLLPKAQRPPKWFETRYELNRRRMWPSGRKNTTLTYTLPSSPD